MTTTTKAIASISNVCFTTVAATIANRMYRVYSASFETSQTTLVRNPCYPYIITSSIYAPMPRHYFLFNITVRLSISFSFHHWLSCSFLRFILYSLFIQLDLSLIHIQMCIRDSRQDDLNLRHVYNDHVNTDMKYEEFKAMCAEAWKDRYGFIVINKDSPINAGRYRVGFDRFIHKQNSLCKKDVYKRQRYNSTHACGTGKVFFNVWIVDQLLVAGNLQVTAVNSMFTMKSNCHSKPVAGK